MEAARKRQFKLMENRKLKIIVTALVPRSANHIGKSGGLSRLVEILKRFEISYGAKVVLVSSDKSYADYFDENGVAAEFKFVRSNLKFKNLLSLCVKSLLIIAKSFFVLKLDFLESKGEKVVAYSSSDLFWEVIPAFFFKTRNRNVEWVQVIHHIYPNWKKRPGSRVANFFGWHVQKFSFWLIRKKADKIILVNSLVKSKLQKMGFPEDKMFICSNGIDLEYFDRIKRDEISYEGVFLGRLSRSKGLVDLVEIWKRICREIPGARLAVIGGGSEEAENFLSKKISEHDLEKNIDLLGFLENEKAHSILKSSKVFVFPSHEEGWGIAIAEAMACEVPVVSWNLSNYKPIFKNYTFQIEENNIDLFAKKVVELLKNDDLRKRFGEEGRKFVKKYSWENVAKNEYEIISR